MYSDIAEFDLYNSAYNNDQETFLRKSKESSYPIMNLSSWLTHICIGKHILVSDYHGVIGYSAFLEKVTSALHITHPALIFEPLIQGCDIDPVKRLKQFYEGKKSELYINAYKLALKLGITIIPGDFCDSQPEMHPDYDKYVASRYMINRRIADIIMSSKTLTISFYGFQHNILAAPSRWDSLSERRSVPSSWGSLSEKRSVPSSWGSLSERRSLDLTEYLNQQEILSKIIEEQQRKQQQKNQKKQRQQMQQYQQMQQQQQYQRNQKNQQRQSNLKGHTNWHAKYLKYKQKYLKLKTQINLI
jgi:hypothetical protein